MGSRYRVPRWRPKDDGGAGSNGLTDHPCDEAERSLMLCEAIRITRLIGSGEAPDLGAEVVAAAARVGVARAAALVVAASGLQAEIDAAGAGAPALVQESHAAIRELVRVVIRDERPLLSHTAEVSVLGLPLPALDASGGAMLVARSRDVDPFSRADIALLEEFAGHLDAAWAVDEARRERTAQRLVRDHFRVTAEVHEHVIARLFSLALELISVRRALSTNDASPRLLDAVAELDTTITWLRRSVLEPATVDRLIQAAESGTG